MHIMLLVFNFDLSYLIIFGIGIFSYFSFLLMVSSFFTDIKIANSIIGLLLTLSIFLPLLYIG